MSLLKAFGQRKLQPFLMRLAINKRIQGIRERLLPLVTIEDCGKMSAAQPLPSRLCRL
jgi:hypothetical protein